MTLQLKPQGVTIVDFTASWCPPCKHLIPILEDLEREFGSSLKVLQINVDESPEEAAEFSIMSMPTVILFHNAQPVEKLVGLRSKEVYRSLIHKYSIKG
jgi:thioredoxin 1